MLYYFYNTVLHADVCDVHTASYLDEGFIESVCEPNKPVVLHSFLKASLIPLCHLPLTHHSTLLCFSWLLHPVTRNKRLLPSFCLTSTTFAARHHRESSFQACFIYVSNFCYEHFISEIKMKTNVSALKLTFLFRHRWENMKRKREWTRKRKKTTQQDLYHLFPQCDSQISVGLSSPLNGSLHQHPSINPCLSLPCLLWLRFYLLLRSLSDFSGWKLECSANQHGAERKKENRWGAGERMGQRGKGEDRDNKSSMGGRSLWLCLWTSRKQSEETAHGVWLFTQINR